MANHRQPNGERFSEGGEGIIGDIELFGGEKSEEDENLQEIEVSAKPSAAGRKVEWFGGN